MTLERKYIIYTALVYIFLSCTGIVSATTYSGGSGTSEDPYLLSTDADIDTLSTDSANWSKNFILTQNITLVGNHTPIGKTSPYFTGDFDGNGYAITNLTIYQTSAFTGFFSYISTGGNIHELGVEASSDGVILTSGSYAGVLAGANVGGTVRDCSATGNATSSGGIVGGLVGTNEGAGSINNCSATVNVTGSANYVGGLVGFNANTVFNCSATGNVTSVSYVGGLVGFNHVAGTVSNSFATGTVSVSSQYAGGLVGSNSGTVINSFATGTASGSSNVGGLVGSNSGTVNSYCYYSGSPVSGEGISTSYSNFTNFTFVSGATGLNWNVGGTQDVITTEDDPNYVWKIIDGYTLPYHQYQADPILLAIPGTPESFTNTTGNFWVNHSWSAGSGDLTDSYNVSYGESWQNSTVTYFNHTGLSAHAWSNITVYAYNATDSTLSPGASDNVQVPNNEISILNVSNITGSEGDTITFDINFTDVDSDTPTFNCNQSSLFDNFNTSTGVGSWDIGFSDAGTYDVEFNVSDGYGSIDSQVMTITVSDASTIYVGSGQDDDFTTIQAAINDASQGDTIIVGDGTYNENVVVNKSVTLRSENGAASTNVNASDSSEHAFNLTVNNVTIDGFNVTGVTGFEMAGIYLGYSNNSIVTNNIVNDNNFGIVLDNSENNTLSNNIANNSSYYGIYLSSSSHNTLDDNDIYNNYYGIRLSSSSDYNTLTDNVAMNNTRYGMYFSSSNNNTLTGNDASYNEQYGMYFTSSDNNTLTDNVASYNTYTSLAPDSVSLDFVIEPIDIGSGAGTGIYIGNSDNNVLTGNVANYNEGSSLVLSSINPNAVSPNVEMSSLYSCGFSLSGSENTTLTGNTAIGNEDYAFYSRTSSNCTVDNLEIDTGSMELSFVPTYETAIRSNETISTVPSGKANVNGYLDIGFVEDLNMTIFYDDSGMSSSIESSISLYELDSNEWVIVPNATLNTSGNFVSVDLESGIHIEVASVEEYTTTYGLFRTVPGSSSSSSSSGTRASVSQGQDPKIVSQTASSVKRVTGGSEVEYDFSGSGTPVLGISFDAKEDKGLVVAKVQVLSGNPDDVPSPSGKSYQMLSIDVGSEGTISSDSAGNVKIHFKVSKQWIEENNIDISTIHMTRYHGEQWNDLPTYQEREDDEYFYFYAETPGFSIFEVVGDEIGETSGQVTETSTTAAEEVEEPVEEETANTPGFTALAGIVFVSLAVLMRRK
nr:PGF-pre-PGF domain-containing protein [uncultured Methanolobus sp.]